jgi:hypothetical protein
MHSMHAGNRFLVLRLADVESDVGYCEVLRSIHDRSVGGRTKGIGTSDEENLWFSHSIIQNYSSKKIESWVCICIEVIHFGHILSYVVVNDTLAIT